MKKYRKLVLLTILFLTIGFSAINTVLDINGIISFGYNEEDFNVYFYNVKKDNQNVNEVISEDKKSITINTSDLLTVGDTSVYNYTVANTSKNYDANVKIECESPTSESISLTNVFLNTTIIAGTKEEGTLTLEYLSETTEITEYTCTLSIEAIERTSLGNEFKACEYEVGTEWTYDYTGTEQEFIVPCDGTYKLEVWGAQGATINSYPGGLGAYASGNINLDEEVKLYIYVGQQGSGGKSAGYTSWNNGGSGSSYDGVSYVGSGGASSHILLTNTLLSATDNENILIVSGGGGASTWTTYDYWSGYGGNAGGILGNSGIPGISNYAVGGGGTQNSGGSAGHVCLAGGFGVGAGNVGNNGSGGGGGYYGGGCSWGSGGGGGSSYIGNPSLTEKTMYCYNCQESNAEETKTISTTNVSENPISGYAKQGNGYAKITLVAID